jgi:CMP-N-acetylneuraminic acid synthetase
LSNKSFISPNTVGYVMPEEYSIDIDTQLDWEIAEFLMSRLF